MKNKNKITRLHHLLLPVRRAVGAFAVVTAPGFPSCTLTPEKYLSHHPMNVAIRFEAHSRW